jgi:hypothetical protein
MLLGKVRACIRKKNFIVETPIPKANNLTVTIGAAELVSCNETR